MKLLIVSAQLPQPRGGASARNYYLLKALAREHTVSLLTFVSVAEAALSKDLAQLEALTDRFIAIPRENTKAKRLHQLMNALQGQSYFLSLFIVPEMRKAFETLIASDEYDAVLFENVLLAGYCVPVGIKVIIDQHNLEYEVLQRTYKQEKPSLRKWYTRQECRLVERGELARCRLADLITVTSERERLILQKELPESIIYVVPNGVDVETFTRDQTAPEIPHQIVFTGTMDYYPNIHAVLYFAQKCWPRIREQIPDASWKIIGKSPPPEVERLARLPGVSVTGWVSDMRPHLAEAAVAIAPLLVGGGTRLKILDALSMQRAVVSTSLGCEGLSVEPGKHLLVADQPEAFTEAVITLLQHPELRKTLGDAGRQFVETTYSWERSGASLLQALKALEALFETGKAVC